MTKRVFSILIAITWVSGWTWYFITYDMSYANDLRSRFTGATYHQFVINWCDPPCLIPMADGRKFEWFGDVRDINAEWESKYPTLPSTDTIRLYVDGNILLVPPADGIHKVALYFKHGQTPSYTIVSGQRR